MTDIVAAVAGILGPRGVLTGDAVVEKTHVLGSRVGLPSAIARPADTAEVSALLKLCHQRGQPVVPWGGRTGLAGGAFADGVLALSLERMNRIEAIDVTGGTMTVEAGCILQTACEAADAQDYFLPLDLGARGTATIGGNISTNAGGNRVIRYGMMRDMVLGLEAVLANGTVVSAMNGLLKNNAGYDIKQLFVGTEGTLGVVTRAVLRLRPKPLSQNTAFVAVDSFDKLPQLLRRLSSALSGTLSAFEVMWKAYYDLVTAPPAKGRPIVPATTPFYALVEALGGDPEGDETRFEAALAEAHEDGLVADAVVAKNEGERNAMWALRDDVGQVARNAPIFVFDVSLPIADMPAYESALRAALSERWPRHTLVIFGHLGDCNLHIIVGVGEAGPDAKHAVEHLVYGGLRPFAGSVSAEHGIGLEKRDYLAWCRSPAEIAVMRTMKAALDPRGILNPGKVV